MDASRRFASFTSAPASIAQPPPRVASLRTELPVSAAVVASAAEQSGGLAWDEMSEVEQLRLQVTNLRGQLARLPQLLSEVAQQMSAQLQVSRARCGRQRAINAN